MGELATPWMNAPWLEPLTVIITCLGLVLGIRGFLRVQLRRTLAHIEAINSGDYGIAIYSDGALEAELIRLGLQCLFFGVCFGCWLHVPPPPFYFEGLFTRLGLAIGSLLVTLKTARSWTWSNRVLAYYQQRRNAEHNGN